MELRQLRYFAAVAETCHFGRAAERLHIAQPALSQAIRALEADLGATLFTRTTRQVALTPAGEFLYDETRRVLAGLDATRRGVQHIADGRRGLVRLGLTGLAVFSHLPRIARAVAEELPGVALEIHDDLLTPDQCARLREGTLDLSVVRPPAVGDGVVLQPVEQDRLVLAAPADHRLAHADTGDAVALADLQDEPFVVYAHRDSAVNETVNRACQEVGFAPHRAHEAPGTSVLLALVAAGLGVSLLPAAARAVPLAGVAFRELTDPPPIELCLAWADGPTAPVVDAVRAVVLDHLGAPVPPALPSDRTLRTDRAVASS